MYTRCFDRRRKLDNSDLVVALLFSSGVHTCIPVGQVIYIPYLWRRY